jgi:hypothetical protein
MVGAELSAPSRPAESGTAWPQGVRVSRRSAWRQKTFPESEALLGTASHARYLVVHFPRPVDGGWTFAEREESYDRNKRTRMEPLNKDGDTTIAKTARFVAAYAIETFTGAAPPAQPNIANARLFNARVYAVDTTNLSRLDRTVDAIPANGATPLVNEPAGATQRIWETQPVPVRTRVQKHVADEQERLDKARATLEDGPARIEEARVATATALAAKRAAEVAYRDLEHALDRARATLYRVTQDFASKTYASTSVVGEVDAARAKAFIANARIEALRDRGIAALTPLDEQPKFFGGAMKSPLRVLACALRKHAASDEEARLHLADAALADAADRAITYSNSPSDFAERVLLPGSNASAADIAWFNATFSTPETRGATYVQMLVFERLAQRWFARGHTLEELKECFN